MQTLTGKFTFTVPATSPVEADRGKKLEKTFDYRKCDNESEAQTVASEKKWTFLEMVNESLKAGSKANAYQAALAPHKPNTISEEDAIEKLVNGFVRMGVPEATAREMVAATIASK